MPLTSIFIKYFIIIKKGLYKPLSNIIDYIPALGGAGSSGLPAFFKGM
jgi:hypothetical protein